MAAASVTGRGGEKARRLRTGGAAKKAEEARGLATESAGGGESPKGCEESKEEDASPAFLCCSSRQRRRSNWATPRPRCGVLLSLFLFEYLIAAAAAAGAHEPFDGMPHPTLVRLWPSSAIAEKRAGEDRGGSSSSRSAFIEEEAEEQEGDPNREEKGRRIFRIQRDVD